MPDFAWWLTVKRDLVELTTLDRDALHIYFAVAIQLATTALTRWRLDQWRTLAPLAALELMNEAADLYYEIWPPVDRGMQYWASVHDMFNTIAIPLVIMLVARRCRSGDPGVQT